MHEILLFAGGNATSTNSHGGQVSPDQGSADSTTACDYASRLHTGKLKLVKKAIIYMVF